MAKSIASAPPADEPTNTAAYLAALTDEQRATIERLLATIRAAAPEAEEAFSYGMPGFTLRGRPLAWAAAWRRHYSIYPVNAAQVEAVAEPSDAYDVEKGTLRFRANAPLPYDLVTRLIRARAGELSTDGR